MHQSPLLPQEQESSGGPNEVRYWQLSEHKKRFTQNHGANVRLRGQSGLSGAPLRMSAYSHKRTFGVRAE